MPSAMPRIGVPSGAMIMAPMTVAVESVSTPAIAIMPDERQHDEEAGALAELVAVAEVERVVERSTGWRCDGGMRVWVRL